MRGNKWTKEEVEYLEESWGSVRMAYLIKKLGRTQNAIILKAKRLGLGSKYRVEYLNVNIVSNMLKVDTHTVIRWIEKHGLKARKYALIKQVMWLIKLDDLNKWLKNNQDKWDSRKVEVYELGHEDEWLKEKRKADMKLPVRKNQKWTKEEDNKLLGYMEIGLTQSEIGKRLSRSEKAVQRRISRLREKKIAPPKQILVRWTDEEIKMLLDLEKQGLNDDEIAWELGREKFHIIDKRRNMRENGQYEGYKLEKQRQKETKEMLEMLKNGHTRKHIAEIFGIHPTTVTRRLRNIKVS